MPRADIDATDEEILSLLVDDGRRSASEVGRRVGLSPAAAKRRIDRLEAAGIIRGYTALLDHGKLGSDIEAFTELSFAGKTQVDDIDGTVVHEKIYHDAGSDTPQELTVKQLRRLIEEAGRVPVERDTLYHEVIRSERDWQTGRALALPMVAV